MTLSSQLDRTHRFMTGGTGFMGSHFLLSLHRRAARTTVLTRGENTADAQARLERAAEASASAYSMSLDKPLWHARTQVAAGDICVPFCGLAEAQRSRLAAEGVDEFWHFAASLQFELRSREAIFGHNVGGTRNALELAAALGCRRFVYISTAYTAGTASGPIAEELHDIAGPFNNLYEESKCQAEHEVAAACLRHGMDFRILRPSIIVGPSGTLRTGGSDSGLYGFAGELYRLRGQLRRMGRDIAVEGDPATPLNFIPIDWAVRDLMQVAQTGFADVGPVLHLTSSGGIDIDAVGRIIASHARTPRFCVVPQMERERAPIEVMFDRRTRFYGGYLKGAKRFVRSLPSHPEVSSEQVDGYVRELYKELRGQTPRHIFERGVVPSFDGMPLCAYATPVAVADPADGGAARPVVVLVNAYGMPVDFMLPLARCLQTRFRVLTWESRGVPDVASPFDTARIAVGDHAADLGALLDAHGVQEAHVVGWCTGAQIALRFASENPERVRGLVLLNGCYTLPPEVQITEYRELIRELMTDVAANPAFAQSYYDLIYGRSTGPAGGARKGADTVSTVLNFTEPELLHLTSAPFQSPEALYRYAAMVARFYEEPDHAWTIGVMAPTLLVTGERDVIAHPDETVEVARRIPGAELAVLPEGTHFSLYYDAALLDRVASFLDDAGGASAMEPFPRSMPAQRSAQGAIS
jgi:nucleoside-diphosphate-sugar epimerase/pimeloyl-ACP methyl ester carboxylesterase